MLGRAGGTNCKINIDVLVKEATEGYVASKYERLYEDKLVSVLSEIGIQLVKIVKSYVGGDVGDEEFVFQYFVFVKNDFESVRDTLNESLGLIYNGVEGECNVYGLFFNWVTCSSKEGVRSTLFCI